MDRDDYSCSNSYFDLFIFYPDTVLKTCFSVSSVLINFFPGFSTILLNNTCLDKEGTHVHRYSLVRFLTAGMYC